ncbi:MAG: hypothetical protein JNM55_18685 [Anaerolineales bacterium]|nr:hypothetical protein [Anaerolineales bacterium]
MKKTILIVGLVVMAVAVFGVGVAFAQGITPYAGHGPMMQNGGGYLHTYMVSALAEKLGLKVEDVNARITAGETMYDIAIADGVKAEDFPALMIEVRAQAVSAAVKDGIITQEQADWMNSHGMGRGGYGTGDCTMQNGTGTGYGPGMMNGNGRGMMGGGNGWQNQQTNP